MRLILGATSTALQPEVIEPALLIYRHFRPRREVLPRFGDDALRRLPDPTLVIVGGRDRLLDSAGTRQRLDQAAPHVIVVSHPDVGHLVIGQTRPILDFLRAELPVGRNPHGGPGR
jgi:acetyl esterase/lipase